MKQDAFKQYTIRRVPPHVDRALRHKARTEHKSLNDVLLETLVRGAGLANSEPENHDLDDCLGTWEQDPQLESTLAAQRRIDRRLWE